MTIDEARRIGREKLNIGNMRMDEALNAAKEMGIEPQHMGPLGLALAVMQKAQAINVDDLQDMQSEMTDALALVSMAENEWRMEHSVGKGRA